MEWFLLGVIIVLICIMLLLVAKLCVMRRAIREIEENFAERLRTDTNTLITISSRDRYLRHLADCINKELQILRREHHRFWKGDRELKTAITNISHDLRTPLTAICGYLDLLSKEEKSEEVQRYLTIIGNRVNAMKQLTEELFRYSVVCSAEKPLKKESVVLNSVLEESIAGYYAALQNRNITPVIKIPERRIIRQLDRAALSRVFTNLLNNALKYSDGDLEIHLSETGEFTFENTASKLDEVQVGKLFDRFYTVESARQSTGLGLSIARTLVEQMGGCIGAEYYENKLRIFVLFPEKD